MARLVSPTGDLAGCAGHAASTASGSGIGVASGGADGPNQSRLLPGRQRASTVIGSGFAPGRTFDVAIDGVDFGRADERFQAGAFGQSAAGARRSAAADIVQHVDHLNATDGDAGALTATFTVTRPAGARVLATRGEPRYVARARSRCAGFALDGRARSVYVHYVSPSGSARKTVKLGMAGGQCGYLRTGRVRVFPFAPSRGSWTLQVDTRTRYTRRPRGPVSRIPLQIS